jgi:hypothetical protein
MEKLARRQDDEVWMGISQRSPATFVVEPLSYRRRKANLPMGEILQPTLMALCTDERITRGLGGVFVPLN